MMATRSVTLWYDYVEPASWWMELQLRELLAGVGPGEEALELRPLEILPPPAPLLDPEDPLWLEHLGRVREEAAQAGRAIHLPSLIPWSRKAHELALHAREKGCFAPMHSAIFQGFVTDARDIGRVDVLVELAVGVGLDPSEVRAVLDVDRFAAQVEAGRLEAAAAGVRGVPTVMVGEARLEGFHSRASLEAFLASHFTP